MLRATKVDGHVKHGCLPKDRTVFCLLNHIFERTLRGGDAPAVLVLFCA